MQKKIPSFETDKAAQDLVDKQRVAEQVAHLSSADEANAIRWIEAVSEFDSPAAD